jgi:uncharacterized C2H2 Zn-finger protein
MDKVYKCLRCHKIFEYNYLLERHSNKKNLCTINSKDSYKFSEYNFDELKELLRKNLDNQDQLSNIIDNIEKYVKIEKEENNINENKTCKACNKIFKTKQNYQKHLKTEKCKLQTIKYNLTLEEGNKVNNSNNKNSRSIDIVNSNNSNNLVNSNNNNNIVVNNTFVVYPVGCESLSHIDINKFKNTICSKVFTKG